MDSSPRFAAWEGWSRRARQKLQQRHVAVAPRGGGDMSELLCHASGKRTLAGGILRKSDGYSSASDLGDFLCEEQRSGLVRHR